MGSACTGARRVPGLSGSDHGASNCQGEKPLFINHAYESATNYAEIVAGNAPKNDNLWCASRDDWRRGGDSNPRCPCRHAAFRVRCIQPLCHLSSNMFNDLSRKRPSALTISTDRPLTDNGGRRRLPVRYIEVGMAAQAQREARSCPARGIAKLVPDAPGSEARAFVTPSEGRRGLSE